jgi:hypothetical protein
VQLQHHHEPSRYRRAVPGNQPVRRQLCPEYFSTIRPRWRATTIPGSKYHDRQEGRGLVRNQRRTSAVRARRPMDHVQRRSRPKVETGARFALDLCTPTAPNAIVKPIHPKSMPAVLTTSERDVWRLATKQKRFNGHCRIMPSVSSAAGPPKKTAPRHEIRRSATSYRE